MGIRIHTVGASGSGTTTLAKALAEKLDIPHFDTDAYYWEPTDPPFTTKRSIPERLRLLNQDLDSAEFWTLSGSLVSWGDTLVPRFTHIVFLYIPQELRLQRLAEREKKRYGNRIDVNGDMHQLHLEFLDWASKYDNGGLEVRSKMLHEDWLKKLTCQIVRIEEPKSISEQVNHILECLT